MTLSVFDRQGHRLLLLLDAEVSGSRVTTEMHFSLDVTEDLNSRLGLMVQAVSRLSVETYFEPSDTARRHCR